MNVYFYLIAVMIVIASGCANLPEYNSVTKALTEEYLLNEQGFNKIKIGMTSAQVHELFGDHLVVGYTLDTDQVTYKPQIIPNPYRVEMSKTSKGSVAIEYYVARIMVPDGIISDNEMTPLMFQAGILISIGWDSLNQLLQK